MIISIILLFSLTASLGLFLVILGIRYRRKSLTIGLIHAGIGLMQTLESACGLKKDMDINIMWNRGSLADMGKLQIVGHCPAKIPKKYYVKEKLAGINIDTGCVFPHFGVLSAMRIPDMSFIRVECKD